MRKLDWVDAVGAGDVEADVETDVEAVAEDGKRRGAVRIVGSLYTRTPLSLAITVPIFPCAPIVSRMEGECLEVPARRCPSPLGSP